MTKGARNNKGAKKPTVAVRPQARILGPEWGPGSRSGKRAVQYALTRVERWVAPPRTEEELTAGEASQEVLAMIREGLPRMFEACREMLRQGDYEDFLFRVQSPFRLEAVSVLGYAMDDKQYWKSVRDAWDMSYNQWEYKAELRELFLIKRPCREKMMNAGERSRLAKLTDPVTVFRGARRELNEMGWSWSLDRDRAEWFATFWRGHVENRVHSVPRGQPVLIKGVVAKKNIIAYLNEREEEEVIIDPKRVKVASVEPVADPAGDASSE